MAKILSEPRHARQPCPFPSRAKSLPDTLEIIPVLVPFPTGRATPCTSPRTVTAHAFSGWAVSPDSPRTLCEYGREVPEGSRLLPTIPLPRIQTTRAAAVCKACGQAGHNIRTCPRERLPPQCPLCGWQHRDPPCPPGGTQADPALQSQAENCCTQEQEEAGPIAPRGRSRRAAAGAARGNVRQMTTALARSQADLTRERDRLQHQAARAGVDEEEADEVREHDRQQHQAARADMDEEEADAARDRGRLQRQALRAGQAITADNLPYRFAEQPACICSSCRRFDLWFGRGG